MTGMKSDAARTAGRCAAAIALALTAAAAEARAAPLTIGGDDRLFLTFVEDAAIVRKGWLEAAVHYDRPDDGLDVEGTIRTAFRLGRNVEVGFLGGIVDRSRDAGDTLYGTTLSEDLESSGLIDPHLYGKFRFLSGAFELAAGAGASVPVADEDRGLGPGSARYEVFLGMRRTFASACVVGALGVSDGDDDGAPGRAAPRRSGVVGAGLLVPLPGDWTFVGEYRRVGGRHEGDPSESRVLVGLDWRPTENTIIRGAVAAAVDDAAPPFGAVISGVFHF